MSPRHQFTTKVMKENREKRITSVLGTEVIEFKYRMTMSTTEIEVS